MKYIVRHPKLSFKLYKIFKIYKIYMKNHIITFSSIIFYYYKFLMHYFLKYSFQRLLFIDSLTKIQTMPIFYFKNLIIFKSFFRCCWFERAHNGTIEARNLHQHQHVLVLSYFESQPHHFTFWNKCVCMCVLFRVQKYN